MFKKWKSNLCGKNLVNERKNKVAKIGKGPKMKGLISQDKDFGYYSNECHEKILSKGVTKPIYIYICCCVEN